MLIFSAQRMNSPDYALGIDIGGTKIAIGVVAADGRVLACRTLPTESRQGIRDATERVAMAVRQVLQDCGLDCDTMAGVGIGCAGPVNPLSGEINNPHTLPGWEGWNIVNSLKRTLDLPVWLENDADTAGLGEYYYGSGRGAATFPVRKRTKPSNCRPSSSTPAKTPATRPRRPSPARDSTRRLRTSVPRSRSTRRIFSTTSGRPTPAIC